MSVQILPNGTGEILGDPLVTGKPLYLGGAVWYVCSINGSDSYLGNNKSLPKATISSAYGAASAGDIIVCLDGHAETISTLSLSKDGITIVASGQSNGKPTVKLKCSSLVNPLFTVSGQGVQLRNLWFAPNTVNGSSSRIVVTQAGFRMNGCYMEMDAATDSSEAGLDLQNGASYARVDSTTFISTTPSVPLPLAGLYISGTTPADITVTGCIFSGQFTFGALYSPNVIPRLRVENPTLLLGAKFSLGGPSQSYAVMASATSDGEVSW